MPIRHLVVPVLSLAFVIAGCASSVDDGSDEAVDDQSADALTTSTTLHYEGTCNFLRQCSTWSRDVPAGEVLWGCTGQGACSDTAHWLAGPSREYCGKTVKLCKGTTCTTAVVKDISVSHSWEASNGVMDALDMDYGLSGRCSGFGGGKVTLKTM